MLFSGDAAAGRHPTEANLKYDVKVSFLKTLEKSTRGEGNRPPETNQPAVLNQYHEPPKSRTCPDTAFPHPVPYT